MPLCKNCQNILPHIVLYQLGELNSVSSHLSTSSAKQISDTCLVCKVLADGIGPGRQLCVRRNDAHFARAKQKFKSKVVEPYLIRLYMDRSKPASQVVSINHDDTYLVLDLVDSTEAILSALPTPVSTDDLMLSDVLLTHPKTYELRNEYENSAISSSWLRRCVANHRECSQLPAEQTPLPSRVLSLRQRGTSDEIYLIDSSAIHANYAALSHCWGPGQPLTTTRDTLDERQEGIRLHQLPRLFQEAVRVARDLGLYYLWIDALCIVQDDAAEWESEAARMGDIFRNAHVTLAATAAEDSSRSLHPQTLTVTMSFYTLPGWKMTSRERDHELRSPMHAAHSPSATEEDMPVSSSLMGLPKTKAGTYIPTERPTSSSDRSWPDVSNGIIRQQEDSESNTISYTFVIRSRANPVTDVIRAPLNRRGWTLQEMMLSRRTLHFTRSQIYWHCKQLAVSCDDSFCDTTGTLTTRGWYYGPNVRIDHQADLLTPSQARPNYIRPRSPDSVYRLQDREERLDARHWWRIVEDYSGRQLTHQSDRLIALVGVASLMQRALVDTYLAGIWKRELCKSLLWEPVLQGANQRRSVRHEFPSWSWASIQGPVRTPRVYDTNSWRDLVKLDESTRIVEDERSSVHTVISCLPLVGDPFPLLHGRPGEISASMYGSEKLYYSRHPRVEAIEIGTGNFDAGEFYANAVWALPVSETEMPDSNATVVNILLLEATGVAEHEYRRVGIGVIDGKYYSTRPHSKYKIKTPFATFLTKVALV